MAAKTPQLKGSLGESYVNTLLKSLNVEEYIVLHDLLLPHKNGTTQIDHVVLSPYGIYVIETKNYKGWIFGKEKQRNWIQVNYSKKNTFLNPVFQNYAHISSLKEILASQYNGPYFSVIAFSAKATLKNIELESEYVKVVYIPQLLKTILANKSSVISTDLSRLLAKKLKNPILQVKNIVNTMYKLSETNLKNYKQL